MPPRKTPRPNAKKAAKRPATKRASPKGASRKAPTRTDQAKKVADLFDQLQKAGANVANLHERPDADVKELMERSKLSTEALRQIGKREGVDFTAWVAWNLRF